MDYGNSFAFKDFILERRPENMSFQILIWQREDSLWTRITLVLWNSLQNGTLYLLCYAKIILKL
jgi:hypothetical protein